MVWSDIPPPKGDGRSLVSFFWPPLAVNSDGNILKLKTEEEETVCHGQSSLLQATASPHEWLPTTFMMGPRRCRGRLWRKGDERERREEVGLPLIKWGLSIL